jgi:hypothetical protein
MRIGALPRLRGAIVKARARFTFATIALALMLSAPSALAASAAPTVSTGGFSNVTYSSVNLYGVVNARGLVTSYAFQYGATSVTGAQTPLAPAGNGTIPVRLSASVSGLQPDTTYRYRILAINSMGTAYGSEHTLKTASVPLSLQIAGVPDPVSFGSPFFVEGNLSGTGAADHEVALQANPYPYSGGFKDVGNPEVTSSTGGFSFPYVGLLENAQLRVVTVGKPEVTSPVLVENVAVRVSFHARRTRRRGYFYLYGEVSPAEPGALVGFQLLAPGKSINEGGTGVQAGTATVSHFARVVHIRHPGLYRALIQIFENAHVSAYSEPILIR